MGNLGDGYIKNKEKALEKMIEEAMGFAEAHKNKEILLRGYEEQANGERAHHFLLIKYANSGEANTEEYGFYERINCDCCDCHRSQVVGITYKLNVFRVTDKSEKIKLKKFVKKFQGDESPNEKWFRRLPKGENSENLISIYADFQTNFRNKEYIINSCVEGVDVPLDIARSLVVALVD